VHGLVSCGAMALRGNQSVGGSEKGVVPHLPHQGDSGKPDMERETESRR